jgi:hypothetical protein
MCRTQIIVAASGLLVLFSASAFAGWAIGYREGFSEGRAFERLKSNL